MRYSAEILEDPLPPAEPGEFVPRRVHVVRQFWLALFALVPLFILTDPGFGVMADHPAVLLAVFALVGFAVGLAQASWSWGGSVPRLRWASANLLGWPLGVAIGFTAAAGLKPVLSHVGIDLSEGAAEQLIALGAGAGAGAVGAALQGLWLRRQHQPWRWWVKASAGATACAWLLPQLL